MAKFFKTKVKKKTGGNSLALHVWGAFRKMIFFSLPYLLVLVGVGALFGGIIAYAINSSVFRLTEVKILNIGTVTQAQAFNFCELKPGENLITLDLVNVQQMIKRRHPEFKEVLVRRVLPNRIEVLLKRRTPAAQIAFSKYVQVDRDMILLPGSSTVPFKNLTTIEGVPVPRAGLLVGMEIKDSAGVKALKLTEVIHRSNVLRNHILTKIKIADRDELFLVVDGSVEIRLGNNHLIERLKILDQTLKTMELDPSKIRYIDLRFDDLVIGPV